MHMYMYSYMYVRTCKNKESLTEWQAKLKTALKYEYVTCNLVTNKRKLECSVTRDIYTAISLPRLIWKFLPPMHLLCRYFIQGDWNEHKLFSFSLEYESPFGNACTCTCTCSCNV